MSKHTPGPWIQQDMIPEREGELYIMPASSPTDPTTTICYIGDMEVTTSEDHYNADLICAAPDLLDACITLQRWSKEEGEDVRIDTALDFIFEKVNAAIAKATGEAINAR